MNPTNVINQFPYLRDQRKFPSDIDILTVELDRSYVDIANVVNARTIGIFPQNRPAITGNSFYLQNEQNKKQSLRQVYNFTSTGSIPHGVPETQYLNFNHCWGYYTDGTNFYGVSFGTSVAVAGQVSFYVTPTDIVIISGAGIPLPIVDGNIFLEWMTKN